MGVRQDVGGIEQLFVVQPAHQAAPAVGKQDAFSKARDQTGVTRMSRGRDAGAITMMNMSFSPLRLTAAEGLLLYSGAAHVENPGSWIEVSGPRDAFERIDTGKSAAPSQRSPLGGPGTGARYVFSFRVP
jgi:hypothetical protein